MKNSPYYFGLGPGWLTERAAKIAKRYGAILVNYTDPECKCGHGCPVRQCHASRRHWFEAANRGAPFDGRVRGRVAAALKSI